MSQEDTPPIMEVVGPACGRHGPYTFFKYCHCKKPGLERSMKLGDFLFLNMDSLSLILAELQLVWRNRSDPDQLLCSLRIYYRPENTPGGRTPYHDKNELLCCSEKIVVRAEDLVTWLCPSPDWNIGLCPPPVVDIPLVTSADLTTLVTELLPKFDWCPILLDNILEAVRRIVCPPDLSNDPDLGQYAEADVHVVSFNRYCRLQALLLRMRQFESPAWLRYVVFYAVCGLEPARRDVRVLFCRQTFECEDLKKITKRCDYLAPNLKGRPRKRCRLYETQLENRKKARRAIREQVTRANRAAAATPVPVEKPTPEEKVAEKKETLLPMKEKDFMKELRAYMKELKMPLGKVPCLGGKSIDLFKFYKFVQDHGGYQKMCDRRLWKRCYEHLKCPRASTAAATQTRKHYEKLLLPYEAHQKERACQQINENDQTPKSPAKRAKTKAQVKKESETRMGQPLTGHENSWPVVKNRRKTKQKPKSLPPDEQLDSEFESESNGVSLSKKAKVAPTCEASENPIPESVEECVIISEDSEQEEKIIQFVPPIEEEEIVEIDLRCSEEMDSKFIPVQPKPQSISPVMVKDNSTNQRACTNDVTRDIVTQTPSGQTRQFESQSEVTGKFTVSNLSLELSGTIYDYVSNVIGQALNKNTTANQSRGLDTTANQNRGLDQNEPEMTPSMASANQNSAHKRSSPLKYRTILPKSESLPKPLDIVQPISSSNQIAQDLSADQTSAKQTSANQTSQELLSANHNSTEPVVTTVNNKSSPLTISTNRRPSVIQPSSLVGQLPPMPPLLANYEPISPPTPETSSPVAKPTFVLEPPKAERPKLDSLFASSPKLLTALSPGLSPCLPPGLSPCLPPGLSPGLPPRRSPSTSSPSTPHKSPRRAWTPSPFSWNPTNSPIPSTSGPAVSGHPSTSGPADDDLPLDLSMKPKLVRTESTKTETETKNDTGALDLSLNHKYDGLLGGSPQHDNTFQPRPVPKLIPLHRSVPILDVPRSPLSETVGMKPGTSTNYWKQNHLNPYSNGVMYTAAQQTGPNRSEASAWDRIYSLYSLPQQQQQQQQVSSRPSQPSGPETSPITQDGRRASYAGYSHQAMLNEALNSHAKQTEMRPELRPEVKGIYSPYSLTPARTANEAARPTATISAFGPAYMDYMSQLSYLSHSREQQQAQLHHSQVPQPQNPYPVPVPQNVVLCPQQVPRSSAEQSVLTASAPGTLVSGMYGTTQVPAYYGGYMSMLSSRPSPSYKH